jgi:hypothetical protein
MKLGYTQLGGGFGPVSEQIRKSASNAEDFHFSFVKFKG